MSDDQSDCFFSMLEHGIVLVHATKFAKVETGLKVSLTIPHPPKLIFDAWEAWSTKQFCFVVFGFAYYFQLNILNFK